MRIYILLLVLVSNIYSIDILNIDNRYNFTVFNDSITGKNIDYFATNGGIVISKNGKISEISKISNGAPIGKVISIFNDADSILWIGTESRGLFKRNNLTGEIFRSTEFDDFFINSIARDSNSLYLATYKGLVYFDPKTMVGADNVYKNFGIYNDSITKVKIENDTIYIKHTGNKCSKSYKKSFLGDGNNWINFVDSLNLIFPIKKIVIGDDIKNQLSEDIWYTDIYGLVSGVDGVFLGANFNNDKIANVAKIDGGKFENIVSPELNDQSFSSMDLDYNLLTVSRTYLGVVAYNTKEKNEYNRYQLGVMPGRETSGAVTINNTKIAVVNMRYYKPNGDDRSQINYDGGLTIIDTQKDSSFNIIADSTNFLYDYKYPAEFKVSVNKNVMASEENYPTNITKITDSLYAYVMYDNTFLTWDTKGTYTNTNDDEILMVQNLGFGATPSFMVSFNGKIILGESKKIALYNDNRIFKNELLDDVIDGNFINDSIIVFLQKSKISFVNTNNLSNVFEKIDLVDLGISEIPSKLTVNRDKKEIFIVSSNSITKVKYLENKFSTENLTKKATVYPNPYYKNFGELTIINLLENSTITIYSSLGKVVNRFKTPYGQNFIKWNAINSSGEKVSSGIYYIIIDDERGVTKFKLLVL